MSPEIIQHILMSTKWAEDQISKKILIPCFNIYSVRNGLKLRDIKFTGGSSELGNDIEYYEIFGPDKLRFYTGIQVKKGSINQSESVQLITQGIEAFEKEIKDTSNGQVYRINRWIVTATGKITNQAQEKIIQQLERYAKPIHFWDGLKISALIMEFFYREFVEIMGVDNRLAASENLITNYWDPDDPQIITKGFAAASFKKLDISRAVPPIAFGVLLTVKPNDKNIPSVKCVIRSSLDEIIIDSLQSQLQPYLLKLKGQDTVEGMILDKNRPVDILGRGYIFIR